VAFQIHGLVQDPANDDVSGVDAVDQEVSGFMDGAACRVGPTLA
jgi:hypothetical protein